jgi:hypothetical protein
VGGVESCAQPRTKPPWEGFSPAWRTRYDPLTTTQPLRKPRGQPSPVFHTPSTTFEKTPHKITPSRVFSTRFPQPGWLWASGNPLAEAQERLTEQGNLTAQLAVIGHLPLNLGTGVNDRGVVSTAQGGADADQRGVSLFA